MELSIWVDGDPPNKAAAAYRRNVEFLREELGKIKMEPIVGDVSIFIDIFTEESRYTREGLDHIYIGDIDNLLSGIIDEIKNSIIKDDSQIKHVNATKKIHKEKQSKYNIVIGW
ncbi:MAG: RusA family crossover junction endodeoxyribonuclease [Candidatus Odinarchaeia archaeon]